MGFALTLNSLKGNIDEDDAVELTALLRKRGIDFQDFEDFESWVDDFYDGDGDDEGESYVSGPELAWGDWSHVQALLAEVLGESNVPTALHIHAWYGVAVPGDIENTYLREPNQRERPRPKLGLLQRLGLFKPKSAPAQAQDDAEEEESFPLVIVSAPRLLAEMEAAIAKLGIADRDFMAIYRSSDGFGTPEMASVSLQIFHKVLKDGYAHRHLVWWIK